MFIRIVKIYCRTSKNRVIGCGTPQNRATAHEHYESCEIGCRTPKAIFIISEAKEVREISKRPYCPWTLQLVDQTQSASCPSPPPDFPIPPQSLTLFDGVGGGRFGAGAGGEDDGDDDNLNGASLVEADAAEFHVAHLCPNDQHILRIHRSLLFFSDLTCHFAELPMLCH